MVNFTFEAPANSTTRDFNPFSIVDICNLLFGLPTHSYIIWLIMSGSGVASGFFNLNLSVCEICNCVSSLISLFESWSPSIQTSAMFFIGLAITGRPLFQSLICVERYLAVVHPVTFLKSKPLRYRLICCTVAWIITLTSCLCCMFTVDFLYIFTWFFSVQFLLFFFVQLFCLVAVLRALKQSGPGEKGGKRDAENHMKKTAFYILITTVSMTVIYMPFTILGFFYIVSNIMIRETFNLGLICFVLAGFVQPILYLNRTGKLCCLCFQ